MRVKGIDAVCWQGASKGGKSGEMGQIHAQIECPKERITHETDDEQCCAEDRSLRDVSMCNVFMRMPDRNKSTACFGCGRHSET